MSEPRMVGINLTYQDAVHVLEKMSNLLAANQESIYRYKQSDPMYEIMQARIERDRRIVTLISEAIDWSVEA